MKVNEKIKFYDLKDTEIGLHYTPAKWIGKPEIKDTMFIRYAFGSGWRFEYVDPFTIGDKKFIELTRVNGTKFTLNTSSIIEFETQELIICNQDNQNDNFPLGPTKYYLIANPGTKITTKNDFDRENFNN